MAVKVNLKKYLAIDGKWQFAPVLKLDGRPQPAVVLISGEPTKGTTGTFYIEWREHGKRIQQPVGTTPREAKDAWQAKVAELDGDAPASEETATLPIEHLSIKEACDNYLTGVQATKAPSTYDAYSADMEWFQRHITRSRVAHVTRTDILRLLAAGREQGLSQASINRRVMVGSHGSPRRRSHRAPQEARLAEDRRDEIETYTPEEITAFLEECTDDERLLFQTYLVTGFRNREVATLTWDSIDW
jgi:integrase